MLHLVQPIRRAAAGRRPVAAILALLTSALVSVAAHAGNGVGAWSAGTAAPWSLIPIHAVLLPDGRVLTYGTNPNGKQTGRFYYDLWDPRFGLAGGHSLLPNTTPTDLFCNAQLVLPFSGNVIMLGGDNWIASSGSTNNRGNNDSVIFTSAGGDHLVQGADMNRKRWYATATTLASGDVYVQGGRDGGDQAEVRSGATGTFRPLTGFSTSDLLWYYPRNWLAPDGKIFGTTGRTLYRVDPSGSGSLTLLGTTPFSGPNGVTSSEVMYAPGKILRTGGGAFDAIQQVPGRNASITIDINNATPKVDVVQPMPFGLHWHTATVTADGTVVVTGGSPSNNVVAGANNRALIWRPATATWTIGAATASGKARLYHSTALLLPDGSILVGGGGAPGPQTNTNAEIYYPPYLFTATGGFAARPQIVSAPSGIRIGQRFTVKVNRPNAIKRMTLVRTGSVTHSFNMDQRFIPLLFTRSSSTDDLSVAPPANLNTAPPGYYLLFAIDAEGVPSVARIVRVTG